MNFRPLSDLIFYSERKKRERERGREREREEREGKRERGREKQREKSTKKEALTCDLPVDRMEKYGKIHFGSQS